MKGDLSRETFQPELHYSAVRMQQGRVQLDADLNEQAAIVGHRAERDSADVIGASGAPQHTAAFGIVTDLAALSAAERTALGVRFGPAPFKLAAGDFVLTPGTYWVDGILCESEFHVPYTRQPDLPGLTALDPGQPGDYIVYVDVWRRHVTALEAPRLRETALGGPDTATRARTVWQVRTVAGGGGSLHCLSEPAAYKQAIAPSTGTMRARALPETTADKPCIVPAGAGFRGLENQLYRVEIHDPGDPYDLAAAPGHVALSDVGETQVVYAAGSWSVGQAVEVFLSGPNADPMTAYLAHVTKVEIGPKRLTLSAPLPAVAPTDLPRLRPVKATLKWSRDNGAVASLVTAVSGTDVTVQNLGPDELLGFRPGDWVELIDRARELTGAPGHLGRVKDVLPGGVLRLYADAKPFPGDIAQADPERGLVARRWDGAAAVKVKAPANRYMDLEDGVQVSFEPGTFATGDYWTITARTATADSRSGRIEWPDDGAGAPAALRPAGIEHHTGKLAVLAWDGTKLTLKEDCRPLFPPVTELATLVVIAGDGQEARPGHVLPQELVVGVFRGRWPVPNARIAFETPAPGKLAPDPTAATATSKFAITTDAKGIAKCRWLLDPAGSPGQQANVALLDPAGDPVGPGHTFAANLSVAPEVAYTAATDCTYLANATTVQEALDRLCVRPTGGGCAVRVTPDEDLKAVIDDLIGQGARDICICLTAGDHKLSAELDIDAPELTLKIGGCGRGSRVLLDSGFRLRRLRAVVLRDLDVLARPDDGMQLLGVRDVAIESCRIYRELNLGTLVRVEEAERIRIAGCVLDAAIGREEREPVDRLKELLALTRRAQIDRLLLKLAHELSEDPAASDQLAREIKAAAPALKQLTQPERAAHAALERALLAHAGFARLLTQLVAVHTAAGHALLQTALVLGDAGAETRISDCEIVGALSVYGPWSSENVPNVDRIEAWGRALEAGALRVVSTGATLQLRDCRLTRLAVGAAVAHALFQTPADPGDIEMFGAALLSDNVLVADDNVLAAEQASLTGTEFVRPGDVVGVTIGDSAIFTANHGPAAAARLIAIARRHADAANLDLTVESRP
jgi:hypothetical protein